MCIVIDTNAIPVIFNKNNVDHSKLKPVFDWITEHDGFMVYGGTKYLKELKKLPRYRHIIQELERSGRVKIQNKSIVDKYYNSICGKRMPRSFNDQHLVAIIIVSRIRLICTLDKESHPHLKNNKLYPKGIRKPKIYSKLEHSHLLINKNIVGICRNK